MKMQWKNQWWTFYFLSFLLLLSVSVLGEDRCPHPAVPYAATYTNITGGPGGSQWVIKYVCDSGYTLFGDAERECKSGQWVGSLPACAVNVALHKPASASSVNNGGMPKNAVDGKTSTVHEGKILYIFFKIFVFLCFWKVGNERFCFD